MDWRASLDRPITSAKSDRLGRARFARAVADAISHWTGDDSLVIALYGRWGTGKTSVKNLVIEELNQLPRPIDTLEFNPWQKPGPQAISDGFFTEIAITLDAGSATKADEAAVKLWRMYAARFQVAAATLRPVKTFATAWVVALASGTFAIQQPYVGGPIFVLSLLVLAAAFATPWLGTVADAVAKYRDARNQNGAKLLADLKKELGEALKKRDRTLLVVLDDLDRLTKKELRRVVKLVKANADLPRIVFLLCAHRNVVEEALDRPGASGREFLEKIVQVDFDVPAADRAQIEAIFFERLNALLALPGVRRHFDEKRWADIFVEGLRPFFGSLRDVYRFLTSLSFHVGLFRDGDVFEVNAIDLVALETIRVFEPSLYAELPRLKKVLTEQHKDGSAFHLSTADVKVALEQAFATVRPGHAKALKELLPRLFPYVDGVMSQPVFSRGSEDEWTRTLRVADSDVFERYFQLSVPVNDVPQASIEALLSNAGDRAVVERNLRVLASKGLLDRTLDILDSFKQQIPPDATLSFALATCDIEDLIDVDRFDLFTMSGDMHVARIVGWSFKQLEPQARRSSALLDLIQESQGIFIPAKCLSLELDGREKGQALIDVEAEAIPGLKKAAVRRFRQAATDGTLAKHKGLLYLYYRWRDWTDVPGEPETWMRELANNREGALDLIRAGFGGGVPYEFKSLTSAIPIEPIAATLEGQWESVPADLLKAADKYRKVLALVRAGRTDYF